MCTFLTQKCQIPRFSSKTKNENNFLFNFSKSAYISITHNFFYLKNPILLLFNIVQKNFISSGLSSILRISVLNVFPSIVIDSIYWRKKSFSTPQMFISLLANWVTQSLFCPLFHLSPPLHLVACGAASNFSICDQLMLNCVSIFQRVNEALELYQERISERSGNFRQNGLLLCSHSLVLHDRDNTKSTRANYT